MTQVTEEFLIDGFGGNRVFIGRHDPSVRWNGAAVPEFPLETAVTIAGLALVDPDSGYVGLDIDLAAGTFEMTLDPETWGTESDPIATEPFPVRRDEDGSVWVDMGRSWLWVEAEFWNELVVNGDEDPS